MDYTPSIEEVNLALYKLRPGKAPGLDGIPVEILKTGGDHISSEIHNLITQVWNESSVPQKWINDILVSAYKVKGPKAVCGNSRGITLLAHTGMILSRIMLDCLVDNVCPHVIPEQHCRFRSERGTMDMIFSVSQVQEKCLEEYQVFMDLTKAFDSAKSQSYNRPSHKLKEDAKWRKTTGGFTTIRTEGEGITDKIHE
ncbi:uncharacterized protein LOC106868114 [Octopus bimaculoides]|uniref:uncharacterized protein LOC106868114 n=1 Tax=Octopus bimaculoides TaxID=37653 RepID=UPI00071DE6EC|nr:uncharacterized protein LOC106868114 [Octopus bimaculoides]|eukprot:XP_014768729.1 PREDICTED: uncharacterized protein LOC106868114 [Octopus bimaculoides]